MGFPKAAQHFGIPNDVVVYPNSGHANLAPGLALRSAQLNLDWFRFWLQDAVDPASEQARPSQFESWRRMKAGWKPRWLSGR
jgi:hypothetical protein